jgi:hypothetical protein
MSNPVDPSVCLAFVQRYLSGLRGYPLHEDGQRCLAMHLGNYSLSVDHAESILQAFRGLCPTPQELYDVAFNENLRGKFETPRPSQIEQWEKECGPADPDWSTNLLKVASTGNKHKDFLNVLLAMRYQSIRDALYFTEGAGRFELDTKVRRKDQAFWQTAMDGHLKNHPELVEFFREAVRTGRLDALPPVPQFDPTLGKRSLTQAEYKLLSPAIPEVPRERCTICGGSGRLEADEYCTCPMGKDLRLVEA